MARFDGDRLDARDARTIAALLPAVRAFCATYLRLRVEGLEHLPRGPALFVGNHNGGIAGPDLPCTLSTLWSALGPDAPVYALAHDFAMKDFTPLGRVLQKFGAVRASVANAVRIFERGGAALVYPGGDLDAYRHFRRRDEIVLGERSGFARLARDARVPIVPIVAHGAHRSAIIFEEGEGIARALRLRRWGRVERFPLALSLPWGLSVGPWTPHLPLPFPIRLRVLPRIDLEPDDDPARARERVRAAMQDALDEMARAS